MCSGGSSAGTSCRDGVLPARRRRQRGGGARSSRGGACGRPRSRRGWQVDRGSRAGLPHWVAGGRAGQALLRGPDLAPLTVQEWTRRQQRLAEASRWIMEGDLGPYDAPAARLARADNVLTLDFGLMRFVWRAVRRSREKVDFWRWLLTWRRRARPTVLHAVAAHAPRATVHVVRTPRALRAFLLTARTTVARDVEAELLVELLLPLRLDAGWHQQECCLGAHGQNELADDQPGLDGLAKPDFVGEQVPDPRAYTRRSRRPR